jgi:aminopeptidase N
VIHENTVLPYIREGNAFFIEFPKDIQKGDHVDVIVYYHGNPKKSSRPPWDGGFVWQRDSLNRDWIGVACEGLGASSWWPNKDHMSDEPDSMLISCIVPSSLTAVSNGRLRSKIEMDNNMTRWSWFVSYPINNYNVSINIAHYTHFTDKYQNQTGELDLDYYVLDYNLEIARNHFVQVKGMLACFEHYFGEYPFWNDGYKLIETPYWGMEHQSGIAYGNNYENNDFGFDFIIIHESGHEYFGNSVSCNDHAEMWIHESFATYMEALYVEYFWDNTIAIKYLEAQKSHIANSLPIIGPLGVNFNEWKDADMYFKGSWMLHSIRNTINNDSLWFQILHDIYQHFKLKIVSTEEIIEFINSRTNYDLTPVFKQFLTTTNIPELHYRMKKKHDGLILKYNWSNTVEGFNMPVVVRTNRNELYRLYPTEKIQDMEIRDTNALTFATDLFYFITIEKK